MANKTTYTIDFKANYDTLTKVQKELKKIAGGSIKLDLNSKESLANLQSGLDVFIKDLEKRMKDGQIDISSFKQIQGIYKNLINEADKFKRAIVTTSVSPEFTKELEEVDKKISKAKKKAQTLKDNLKIGLGSGFELKGSKASARASTKNQAMTAGKDKARGEYGDLINELPKEINNFHKLAEAYNLVINKQGELSRGEQAIKAVFESTAPIIKEVEESKQKELQPTIDKIEEQKKAVKDLQKEYAAKEKQSLLESKVPDNIKKTNETLSQLSTTMRADYAKSVDNATEKSKKLNKTAKESNSGFNQQDSTLGKAAKNVFTYGTALTVLRTIYRQLINTITDMDKALTNMTVVTNLSREEAWAMVGTLQQLSKETGMVTTQVADMTTKYLQQGKTLHDALILTEAAAKAATVAGIDGSRSVELLTNAVNGFQIAAEDAMLVSDKFAALAASAATDYEGLATALSKVAAQANLAGMSMDFTLGMLTKGIEVTQEAPETIGTALKTVIARMRELTDYGETLEEGMDVNRVDAALKNVGVSLLDANREFRNLDDVLTDLGMKWDTLTRNQQANVAVALAGTRQQSRLIAMMQDFDRTLELVTISQNSAGATAAQHRKYLQGLEAATNRLTTSYQGLITSFMNSDLVIGVINGLSSAMEFLENNTTLVGISIAALIGYFALLHITNRLAAEDMKMLTLLEKLSIATKQRNLAATKQLIFAKTQKRIESIKSAAAHIKEIAVNLKSIIVEKLRLKTTKKQLKANLALAKTQLQQIGHNIAQFFSLKTLGAGLKAVTKATMQATGATLQFTAALMTNPIGWICAIIAVAVGIIIALASAIKETYECQQDSNKEMSTFAKLLQPIIAPIIVLIEILRTLWEVIELVGTAIRSMIDGIKDAIYNIPLLGKVVKGVADFFGNIGKTIINFGDKIRKWIGGFSKQISSFEQDHEEATKSIQENQAKIYEKQQYTSSLKKLLDEYDTLSKKTNKSVEEQERLKELITEIGELDESLVKNGKLNYDKANLKLQTELAEIEEKTIENYNNFARVVSKANSETRKAQLNTEEYKTTLQDIVSLDLNKWADGLDGTLDGVVNSLDITATKLTNIKEKMDTIISLTDLSTFGGDEDALNNFREEVVDVVTNIEMFDGETLISQVDNYAKAWSDSSDIIKNKISLIYPELNTLMNLKWADNTSKESGYAAIDALGLSPQKINDIKTQYDALNNKLIKEGKAPLKDFSESLVDALTSGDVVTAFAKFGDGLGVEFAESLRAATGTTDEFIEDWQKSTSGVTAIAELQTKYQNGELTAYDLMEQQKALGLTAEEMNQIIDGTYDQAEKQKEINDLLEEQITNENKEIQAMLERGDLTDDQRKALQDEKKYNDWVLDNLKNQDLYASELYKKAKAQTQLDKDRIRYNSQINQLKEKISKNEDFNREDYNGLVDYYSNLKATYETELNKGGYLQAAINSKFVEIVDGELIWNTEQAENFRETNKEAWDWLNDNQENIPKWLEEIEKTEDEVTKAYEENSEKIISYVEQEIEAKKELLEQEKENLEKQQENYEDYWDKIDAFDEEREREKTRESIVSQLEALAGGSGSATNARRKELLSQLKDVEKEQQEAQKQAARDALTKSIDEQIASIDKEIEGWDEKLDNLGELKDISNGIDELINKIETEGIWAIPENYKTTGATVVNPNTTIPKNAKGGLVDYTGLAWVDGSLSNPEAFLSAADTQLISELVANLKIASAPNTDVDKDNNITIGTIVIQPNELKNNQDWKSAGTILAQEFKKAIRDRGLPVNAKR